MATKPYDKEATFQGLEKIKNDLYNFSAELNDIDMKIIRRDIIQKNIDEAISNLNTAVRALDPADTIFVK